MAFPAPGPYAQPAYGAAAVPDMVKQFVVYFYRHIRCAGPREDLCVGVPCKGAQL